MADDPKTDQELESIVQGMLKSGSSQDDIAHVVQAYDDERHPLRASVAGFVSGAPSGVVNAAIAPFSIAKDVIVDAYSMYKGESPENARKFVESLADLPKQWNEGGPRERAEMLGNIFGGMALGIGEYKYGPKSAKAVARTTGGAVESTGKLAGWPLRISGSHKLLSGHPIGAAMIAAPELLERGGLKLRQWGERGTGEAMVPGVERLGIPARTLPEDLQKMKLGQRTDMPLRFTSKQQSDIQNIAQKSAGTSAKKMTTEAAKRDQAGLSDLDANIKQTKQKAADTRAATERAEARMSAAENRADMDQLHTEARQTAQQAKQAEDVAKTTQKYQDQFETSLSKKNQLLDKEAEKSGQVASRYAEDATAEAEKAQQTAEKEAQNQRNLARIAQDREGLEPKTTVSESVTGKTPSGTETSRTTYSPKEDTSGLSDMEKQLLERAGSKPRDVAKTIQPVPIDGPPLEERMAAAKAAREARTPSPVSSGGAPLTPSPGPGISIAGVEPGARTIPSASGGQPTHEEITKWARETARRPSDIGPPPPSMKDLLLNRSLGINPDLKVTGVKPAGLERLRTLHGAEEAGDIMNATGTLPPEMKGLKGNKRTNTVRGVSGGEAGLLPEEPRALIDSKMKTMSPSEQVDFILQAVNAPGYKYVYSQLSPEARTMFDALMKQRGPQ